MKISAVLFFVLATAMALPLNPKRDTPSPDATAIEYGLLADTNRGKRDDLTDDTTGWAKREESPDASMVEYALDFSATSAVPERTKRDDSPDATMVEYYVKVSAPLE